jgi:ascorbate-specific PTS system EIIC-type component UlaA
MANRQTSSKAIKAIAGAILLSLGLLLLTANLNEVAAHFSSSLTSTTGSVNTVIDVGLAGLRAVQTYFFDQPTFQAGLHVILVSFWPLILVIIGAALLQNAISKRFASARFGEAFPSGESESES